MSETVSDAAEISETVLEDAAVSEAADAAETSDEVEASAAVSGVADVAGAPVVSEDEALPDVAVESEAEAAAASEA